MNANDTRLATQLVKCSFLADALLMSGERTDPELIDACLSTSTSLWRGNLSAAESELVQRAISAWLNRPFATSLTSPHDLMRVDKLLLPDDRAPRGLCDATWRLLDQRGQLGTQDLMDLERQQITARILDEISALIAKRILARSIYRTAAREYPAA